MLGVVLWLWLGFAPTLATILGWMGGRRELLPQLAPWVAWLTIGLFHGLPWINTGWRTAILLALLMGAWARCVQSSHRPPLDIGLVSVTAPPEV